MQTYRFVVNLFMLILLMIPLMCCSSNKKTNTVNNNQSINKDDLKKLSSKNSDKSPISNIRTDCLRDTALSVGARGGLASRTKEINQSLLGYEMYLYKVFNFYGMLLDNNVLPPVLVEARKTLSLTGNDIIRVADRNYKIICQARFVTNTPTWRDYLWLDYESPETPDKSLLPKNKEEQAIWEKYIEDGWNAGRLQAEFIFKENVNRLQRDLNGMIRYRKLLAQNMVSPPYVATLDLGITGDSSNLTVNDRVLRITAFPSLQTKGKQWKTEIRRHD